MEDGELLMALEAEERSLSASRRRLHDRIDFVRTLSGSTAVNQLATLQQQERELSKRRRKIQNQVRALREMLGTS
jgi:hypothetical protein